MKITRVETRQSSEEGGKSILVFVHTDIGITGIGETSTPSQPGTLLATIEEAKQRILGFDPFHVNAIGAALGWVSGKVCDDVILRVVSGIEAACLDIVGKRLGVPLFQLFGGSLRDELRMCATGWEQLNDTPEDYSRRAREVSDSGFTAIKFDPFDHAVIDGLSLERAVEITCKIRETVGKDVDLIVDANGRFTPTEGIRVANALEPFGLMWLEDLIGTDESDSLESVASAVDVPLAIGGRMVGSRRFREVIERQLVDFVQADSHNVGGISRTRSIALLADSYYMRFALHHSGGPVSLAMNTHVAACAPNFAVVEVPHPPRPSWNKVISVPFEQRDGFLRLSLAPGLGVEYCAELLNPA